MGNSLYSRVRGDLDKPVLILLHGLFGSADNLGGVAAGLSQHFQTHALDLRNHGRSIQSDDMSYELMAQDVLDYIESISDSQQGNPKELYLLGHSMGGKVSMTLALTQPSLFKKVIVADISPVKYPPHHHGIMRGLSALKGQVFANRRAADELLSEFVDEIGVRQFLLKNLAYDDQRNLYLKLNVPAIEANYENIMQGQDQLGNSYSGEILFVAGGASDYIKEEHRETTLSLFPNAQLKMIPGASHWLHAEKPELFLSICERFLLTN